MGGLPPIKQLAEGRRLVISCGNAEHRVDAGVSAKVKSAQKSLHAVRFALLLVTAIFADADLSSPTEQSEKLWAAILAGNDVTIGSRALDCL
jgi:hypothetical protein